MERRAEEMKTIKVIATHPASCRIVGAVYEVYEEPVIGELSGYPMYEIVKKIDGRTQYIQVRFCEKHE
jgi:hypothetical protein